MGCRLTTLQDALSPLQFRTVILLSLGLESWQIADMLDTNEHTVLTCLRDSLRRTGCRDARELSVRAHQECHNALYDEVRLSREMAPLQNAARRILERSGVDPGIALPN
jgi:DNA-binding CsgD family transcriptional regulator